MSHPSTVARLSGCFRLKARCAFILVAAFAMAVLASSCRSSKSAGSPDYPGTSSSSSAATKQIDRGMKAMTEASAEFDSWKRLKVPVKVSGLGIPLSGNAFFDRGSRVYVSLRVLGSEVAFISLTADSVVVVDKFNKRYISEAIADVAAGLPVTIDNVQRLLLGYPFIAGNDRLASSDLRKATVEAVDSTGNIWRLLPPSIKGCSYGFTLGADGMLISAEASTASGRKVSVDYSDFTRVGQTPAMAGNVEIAIPHGGRTFDASLKFNFKKGEFNPDLSIPSPAIPAGCRRIDAASLLRMLESM